MPRMSEMSETDLLPAIQEKLTVSAKVARRLLEGNTALCFISSLWARASFDLGYGGDPGPTTAPCAGRCSCSA